jgi:glutamate racemase
MKKQNNPKAKKILKKIFIKICRLLNYEIIDQSEFYVPTQDKSLNQNLSLHGKKSISIPLGETKITRKVNALTIIFRSCTHVNMLTQNKKRLFDKKKSEYTFRSLNSIIVSLINARRTLPNVELNIIVIDHNSEKNDLSQIKKILDKSNLNSSVISLNVNEFREKIKKINAENKNVTENQISNMSNIHKSLQIAKEQCNDLVYFVEDDYLHLPNTIEEMIFTYERISSQVANELVLIPTDYPYLYSKMEPTNIFFGSSKHWRTTGESLCTFLTSSKILKKHWNKFISMCQYEHYPFEGPLHEIYKSEYCLSPIPSLALHFTNINSIYGLSPGVDWKKIWDDNKNY